jgi:hypothetical protein
VKYLIFLNYLIRHKWHVFVECCRYGVPWRGICHDISKFLPNEFIAYANHYYNNHISFQQNIIATDIEKSPYYLAWLIHQKRNRHHWQWWILHGENNNPRVIPMPEKYIKEMVADWRGAGRAQGQPDTLAWYQANKNKMILDKSTRIKVEQLLQFDRIIDSEYNRGTVSVVNNLNLKAVENMN